jgi:hypothetical protein
MASSNRLYAEGEKFQKLLRFIAASVTQCRVAPTPRMELFLHRQRAQGQWVLRAASEPETLPRCELASTGRQPPIAT